MESEDQPGAEPLGIGGWHIEQDGWISVPTEDSAVSLHVRLQPGEDGRFVISSMLLDARAGVTADLLRQVQPARIEASFNLRGDARTLSHEVAADVLGAGRVDDDITLGELRRRTQVMPPEDRQGRTPLGRPDGTDTEGFYRRVAEAYRDAASDSRRPAAVLAEEAGVPVTTVHRWIREARRRNFLPSGQKGKAG